jgi:hypothetical protein
MLRKILLLAAVCMIVLSFAPLPNDRVQAATAGWQKGGSIYPNSTTDFSSDTFQQSVQNLAAIHANYVTLIIPYYQGNIYSTDIQKGWNTPTDESLASAISYAHSLGLKVMLKPHLDTYDGQWRAFINPSDRNAWFGAYGAMLNHYGQLAQSRGAEQICIGTELIDMTVPTSNSSNTGHWQAMISSLRSIYGGSLTYSAQGAQPEEKSLIEFWPQLDYIGLSAYFNLTSSNSSDISAMEHDWDVINSQQIQPLQQRIGKPLLFTEIGYRSVNGAHLAPWDYNRGGSSDQVEQDNAYQALLTYWGNVPYMAGLHLWNWESNPIAGGNNDTGYTPQHKKAEATLSNWFAGNGTPSAPPAQSSTSFTGVVTGASTSVVNQTVPVKATVKNTGYSQASNILVDLEVYNPANQKVAQQFFSGQSLPSQGSEDYAVPFVPATTGNYTVKVGVFSADWSKNYLWNDSAQVIAVGTASSQTSPPTPSSSQNAQVNIWWPGDGKAVSGVQPFKAELMNTSLSNYSMYWRVDNDQLNSMSDSSIDAPHKESLVDVSDWSWKGNGPYAITFVAKDSGGAILGQKTVNITVSH